MLGVLVHLRWQLWRNRLLRSSGPGGPAARVVLGGASLIIFLSLVGVNTGRLGARIARDDPAASQALIPGLLIAVVVLTITSALSVPLHHLFLAPDLDLLLVAPVRTRDLFGLKVLETWRDSLHVVLFTIVALSAYGQTQGGDATYYLTAVLVAVLLTLGTSALGVGLTTALARLSPSRLVVGVMRVLSMLLFLPLGLLAAPLFGTGRAAGVFGIGTQGTQALAEALRDMGEPPWWAPTTWGAWALSGQPLGLALLVVACAALLGLAYLAYTRAFWAAWEYVRSAPAPRPPRHARSLPILHVVLRPFPAPLRAMLLKDLSTLLRDPRWLTTALIGALMLGAPAVLLSARARPVGFLTRADAFFLSLFAAPYLAYLLGSQLGSSSLAYEGRNIALLRCAPVSLGRLLTAKLCVAVLPVLGVTWAVTIALGIWRAGQPSEVALALLGVGWLSAGSNGAALAGAALTADLTDEGLSPQRRVGCLGSLAASALSTFFFATNGTFIAWLVLQSGSRLPRGLAGLAGVFDVALAALATASVAAIAAGLLLGARRLARVET